MGVVMFKAP